MPVLVLVPGSLLLLQAQFEIRRKGCPTRWVCRSVSQFEQGWRIKGTERDRGGVKTQLVVRLKFATVEFRSVQSIPPYPPETLKRCGAKHADTLHTLQNAMKRQGI